MSYIIGTRGQGIGAIPGLPTFGTTPVKTAPTAADRAALLEDMRKQNLALALSQQTRQNTIKLPGGSTFVPTPGQPDAPNIPTAVKAGGGLVIAAVVGIGAILFARSRASK